MDQNEINISHAEWQVMNVLWENPPLTVGEISKKLKGKVDWNRKTINTLLRRLVEKGALAYEDGRFFKYYPTIEKSDAIRQEMDDVLERVFESSPKKLLLNLVENERFTAQEIQDLKDILNDIEGK